MIACIRSLVSGSPSSSKTPSALGVAAEMRSQAIRTADSVTH